MLKFLKFKNAAKSKGPMSKISPGGENFTNI